MYFKDIYNKYGYQDDGILRPGDKVTVRYDLCIDDPVPFHVSSEMLGYAGREMTIASNDELDFDTGEIVKYRFLEDDSNWMWSFPMFEEYYDLVLERNDIPEDSINEIGVLYG